MRVIVYLVPFYSFKCKLYKTRLEKNENLIQGSMYFLLYLFFGLIMDKYLNTKNFVSKTNFVRFPPKTSATKKEESNPAFRNF